MSQSPAELIALHVTSDQPKSVGGFLDTILSALHVVKITPENKAEIKTAIKAEYDKLCAATDIPRLPPALEARVEQAAWSFIIEPAVDAVLANLGE